VQARRFLEEGHMLRLVVTFKGGPQIALGRDVTLYLIGQLAGRYCWYCLLLVPLPGIARRGVPLLLRPNPCVWPLHSFAHVSKQPLPRPLLSPCLTLPPPLGPIKSADLAKVRDEKQLQRPMRGHWAVQLQPLPPAVDTPAKAPPHKKPAQQQQQQQKQEEQAPQAPSQPQVPPPPPAAAAAGAAG
jgi:hypothetical protein